MRVAGEMRLGGRAAGTLPASRILEAIILQRPAKRQMEAAGIEPAGEQFFARDGIPLRRCPRPKIWLISTRILPAAPAGGRQSGPACNPSAQLILRKRFATPVLGRQPL